MTAPILRLSRADESYLRYETRAAPMQVGALLIVEAAPLVDASGALQLQEIRRRIERRLASVPALRRRLLSPAPLLGPGVWIDDPSFTVARHVRRLALRDPAGDAELLEAVEQLMSVRLPLGHPLWGLWATDRLEGGRVGILLKLHHAIADGVAAMGLLAAFLDGDPHASDPLPQPYLPEGRPSPRALLVDNASRTVRAVRNGVRGLHHMAAARDAVRGSGAEMYRALRAPTAPRTPLNRPVRPGRHVRFTRFDLAAVRSVAHGSGGTINDVILALVAGGIRELLQRRGAVPRQPLIASVPVSLRSASDAGGLGNAVGTIAVPLDTGERDAHRRLEAIVAATRQAKRQQHPAQVGAAMAYLAATPLAQRFITRQHLVNVFISNLAGPTVPLYFLGARIHDAMPIVNPVGNVAVAFCAFSYAGALYLVTTVDASACPDVDVLIVGMRRTWEELGEPAPATTAAQGTPAAGRPPRSHRPRRHGRGGVVDDAAQLSSARPRVTQVRSSSDP